MRSLFCRIAMLTALGVVLAGCAGTGTNGTEGGYVLSLIHI